MAFNINAHVILSGPKNIKAVTKNIQKQLTGVTATVDIKTPKNIGRSLGTLSKRLQTLHKDLRNVQSSASGATSALRDLGTQVQSLNSSTAGLAKSQSRVQASLQKTGKNVQQVGNEIQEFGKDAALAIRRFAAFTVATGVVFGFVRAIQTATKAAIDYEREITKVIQVTGASTAQIGKLKSTIDDLSTSLGVDANELANLARTFAQTGQSIAQVRSSITAVARSSLAPSFGEMKNTAEGLIAALAQFNIAAKDSEQVLASINAVSKKFAVEAEDLVSVIRRAGGVFSQAAGQFDDPKRSLNELIGIFTAVRSTTRESADTIAVGLRTIFTRIQRRGTIEFLKQFNIELVNAQGNFIGLFPAFERLSAGLSDIIRKGDALTLSAITEELGGVRQVGKLIPAITQFNKALAATKIAGEAAKDGLGKDVALALQPLGKRFEQLQQRFTSLIRSISESKTFQNLANVALSLGNAFLTVAENLKPLLPLMATFAAIKISKGIFEFGQGFVGGLRRRGGASGLGDRLGGGGDGGGGGTDGGGTPDRSGTASRQALTNAIRSNSVLLGTNNTALQNLTSRISSNNATLTTTSGRLTSSVTQLIGAIGNLINALNRFSGGFGGLGGGGRRPRRRFARGGLVPGTGNTDTVPAMLQPGEFVLRKSSVGKLGAGTLDAMNSNKFASGGKASDFMASRHLVGERDFTFSKPAGTEFKKTGGKDKNRFNAKDEFAYTRQRDTSINVNSLYRTEQERKDPNYRAYTQASSAQKRGLAFEKILKAKGLVSELAKSPTSRLDAVTPEGTAAEIKSELEALSEARLSEKMIGAALKGKDSIEKKVQVNLTNAALTAARNTIGLGAVEVFQDTTGGLGATRAKKPRRRRFAAGGVVTSGRGFYGIKPAGTGRLTSKQLEAASDNDLAQALQHPSVVNNLAAQGAIQKEQKKRDKQKKGIRLKTGKVGGLFLEKGKKATSTSLKSNFPQGTLGPPFSNVQQLTGSIGAYTLRSKASSAVKDQALPMLENAIGAASEAVVKSFEIPRLANVNEKDLAAQAAGRVDLNAITGHLFEGFTSAVSQAPLTESKSLFDFMSPSAESLLAMGKIFQPSSITERLLEAKKLLSYDSIGSRSKDNSIINKVMGGANAGLLKKGDFDTYKFAAGGSVFKPKGTDTVPAMLTPGEFVINKKSAEKIGYGNLGRMNHYAKGGVAAKGNVMQYFSDGTGTSSTTGVPAIEAENSARKNLINGIGGAVAAISGITAAFASFDAENPLPSIIALGYAASSAASALTVFSGTQAFDNITDQLMGAEVPAVLRKGTLQKTLDAEINKFKDAPAKFAEAFRGARRGFSRQLASGGRGIGNFTKAIGRGATSFARSFTRGGGFFKLLGGAFKGLPGLITAVIAKPLIDAISGTLLTQAFGSKETIEGTDIEGRRGAGGKGISATQGGIAGFSEALGGATSVILGTIATATMLNPVLGALVITGGVLVAGFKLFQGAVRGAAKQLEFNAFIKLQESAEGLSKTLTDFGKLDTIGSAALGKVTQDLEATLKDTEKAVEASINRQFVEGITSFTGVLFHTSGSVSLFGKALSLATKSGLLFAGRNPNTSNAMGGVGQKISQDEWARQGSSGFFDQVITSIQIPMADMADSVRDADKAMGRFGNAINYVSPALNHLTKAITGVSLREFVPILFDTQKTAVQDKALAGEGKAFAKAMKFATAEIDPKTIESLDKAIERSLGKITKDFGALGDMDALRQIADLQFISPDLNAAKTAKMSAQSMGTLNDILKDGIGPTKKFGEELSKLIATATKAKVMKKVADRTALLVADDSADGQKKAGEFSRAMIKLQDSEAWKTNDIEGMIKVLDGMKGPARAGAQKIKEYLLAEAQLQGERTKAIAITELAAIAAARAARSLDALVAGMQQFSTRATGVADQFGILTSSLQNEFSQITGEKLVGKLETFNPFENVAAATDEQIDTAVNQLKGFGTKDDSDQAFREMASLAKGERDLPNVMRDVMNDLSLRFQKGQQVTDADVRDALGKGLKDAGIELPQKVEDALFTSIQGATGGASRQAGTDDFLLSLDKVTKLLAEDGDLLAILGPAAEASTKGLAESFNALSKFKNSLLEVARIQQQIAKHRLKGELEMLSKQESVRNRVNKALGKSPDALNQATTDLRNRLKTVVGAGLQGEAGFAGNVLDPTALLNRLKTVEGERDKRRTALGLKPGQAVGDALQGKDMTKEMRENSDQLAKLNSESNALKQALKELANDTRILAALEQKILEQNAREATAKGGLSTIIDAIDKFSRGEMAPEDFNKQITTPLDTVERVWAGQAVNFQEAVDLMKRFQSGDPLIKAAIDVKAREAAGPGATEEQVNEQRTKLEKEFFDKLTAMGQAMAEAGGLPGLSEIMGRMFANMSGAQAKKKTVAEQMKAVGDTQNNILKTIMETEHKQLEMVLKTAERGFDSAVADFKAAVQDFALMRGGVKQDDIESRQKDVTMRQEELKTVQGKLADAEAKRDKGIKDKGEREKNARLIADLKEEEKIAKGKVAVAKSRVKLAQRLFDAEQRQKNLDEAKTNDAKQQANEESQGAEEQNQAPTTRAATLEDAQKAMAQERKRLMSLNEGDLTKEAEKFGVSTTGWLGGARDKKDIVGDIQRSRIEQQHGAFVAKQMKGTLDPTGAIRRGLTTTADYGDFSGRSRRDLTLAEKQAMIMPEVTEKSKEESKTEARERGRAGAKEENRQRQASDRRGGATGEWGRGGATGEWGRGGATGEWEGRRPTDGTVPPEAVGSIVSAIGACCQVTASRLDEIIRVLGGDLGMVSGQVLSPEEFNKAIQKLISQGLPGVAKTVEKITKKEEKKPVAEPSRMEFHKEERPVAEPGSAMAYGADIAATQGPEIDFPQVHLSDDPEERKWQTGEEPASQKATEAKKEEVVAAKTPGGILGALQTLNNTAKGILKCLCGDIFPEMASTATNTAANTAAVNASTEQQKAASDKSENTAKQGQDQQKESNNKVSESVDKNTKATEEGAEASKDSASATSDMERSFTTTEEQKQAEEDAVKKDMDNLKRNKKEASKVVPKKPFETAEKKELKKQQISKLDAKNAATQSDVEKMKSLRSAAVGSPDSTISDFGLSLGLTGLNSRTGRTPRVPTTTPQVAKTKSPEKPPEPTAKQLPEITPEQADAMRRNFEETVADHAIEEAENAAIEAWKELREVTEEAANAIGSDDFYKKNEKVKAAEEKAKAADAKHEEMLRKNQESKEKKAATEKPAEQKPTPKPEAPTPARGGILGVLISIDKNIKSLLDCCKLGGGGVGGGGGGAAAPMALMDAAKAKADIIKQKADRDIAEVDKNLQTELTGIAEERKGIKKRVEDKFNQGKLFNEGQGVPQNGQVILSKDPRERRRQMAGQGNAPPTIDPTGDTRRVGVMKGGLMRGAMRRGGAAPNLGIQQRVFDKAKEKLSQGDASMMEALIEADEKTREMGGQGVNQFAREFKQEKIKNEMVEEEKRLKAEEEAARKKAETDKKNITDTADKERTKVLDDASQRAQGPARGRGVPPLRGVGGGPAAAAPGVAGGNAGEMIAQAMLQSAAKFATTFSDENMKIAGTQFGLAVQQQLASTDITIKAQMGPITVTLSDNGLLEKLKDGLRGEMEVAITSAIAAKFNADGTVKDPSTTSVVPIKPKASFLLEGGV